MPKIILISTSSCLALCLGFVLTFSVSAADKNNSAGAEDVTKRMANDEAIDGMRQTLNLNFSPENREKLRKALNDYARTADPDHSQIEERRRAMQESIKTRFLEADNDGDNTIDRQEATEKLPQIARLFNMVDLNQDNLISLDELQAAQARILERRRAAELALEAKKLQEADFASAGKHKTKQVLNNVAKPAL
ncbi:EF hand [mine drainage metagenome]|uniref:EF hand n=1 Tax=mine drainage metagenome TaxID=410659 RepID=A0A1J5RHT7_9ZZZZ